MFVFYVLNFELVGNFLASVQHLEELQSKVR